MHLIKMYIFKLFFKASCLVLRTAAGKLHRGSGGERERRGGWAQAARHKRPPQIWTQTAAASKDSFA